MNKQLYNAHHSPIAAMVSFTLGCPGKKGGLGLDLGTPANQNIYIGVERRDGNGFDTLPFFEQAKDEMAEYDVEMVDENQQFKETLRSIDEESVERDYGLTTDTFRANDIEFSIINPFQSVPDPSTASDEDVKKALLPAIYAELTIDNQGCDHSRRAYFGFNQENQHEHMRHLYGQDDSKQGIAYGRRLAIVTEEASMSSAVAFSADMALIEPLKDNWLQSLGDTGLLIADVPAGQEITYSFAICFYVQGIVTTGKDMSLYYSKYFDNLESVADYALRHMTELKEAYIKQGASIDFEKQNDQRQWMTIHAIRSYYGSTYCLSDQSEPFWIVNEGEYRMMNTLDLSMDHLFFELKMNPWVVKNIMMNFLKHYSYEDQFGISFTHDMGVVNAFSRESYSSYEKHGLTGCFSYMTYEELLNWVTCTITYIN